MEPMSNTYTKVTADLEERFKYLTSKSQLQSRFRISKGDSLGMEEQKKKLLEEKTEIYSIMQDIQAFERDLEASTKTMEDHSGM